MPVKILLMMLEKSSVGKLELVKKTMFMSTMERQKLVMKATKRKIQVTSKKSGEGRESGTPRQAPRL